MAKLVPGSLINGASGSIGTTTFSHNRGGWYSKSRVTPLNPSSLAQQKWRAAVKFASQRWGSTLTDAQRLRWATLAMNFPRTNSVSAPIVLTGANLYQLVNANAKWFVDSVQDNPTSPLQFAVINSITLVGSVGATSLSYSWDTDPADNSGLLAIFMGRPLGPGRSAPDGTWSNISRNHTDDPQPQNLWANYIARYGAPVAGQKTFWRAWCMVTFTYMPCPYLHGFFTWGA